MRKRRKKMEQNQSYPKFNHKMKIKKMKSWNKSNNMKRL
jgi:hypothetical protein